MRRAAWPRRAPNGSRSAALTEMRAEWRDLVARALEPNVFYDPAFALPAARVFGADVGAVLVWSKTAPRLIGLFPARVERRYGMMGTLTGWTHPYAPFGVPLVDREEAEAAIGAFLDHVEADTEFPKLVMLPLIARDGPFAAALARVLARRGGASEAFRSACPRAARAAQSAKAISITSRTRSSRSCAASAAGWRTTGALVHMAASGPMRPPSRSPISWRSRPPAGKAAPAAPRAQHAATEAFMREAVTALAAKGDARIDRLDSGRPSGRGVDHAAQRLLPRGSGRSPTTRRSRARRRACSSRSISRAICSPTPRWRRPTSCATAGHPMIDHLWKERLDALRHADRAKRGIDGNSPHRAAA